MMEEFKGKINSTFHLFSHNESYAIPGTYDIDTVDSAWVLSSALIFFTMQTGLALIEAGILSKKNEVNVMMKKFADICCIGFAYYVYGFAFMYGRGEYTNPFIGLGDFFVNADKNDKLANQILTFFFFQISFASTSTTIASGGAGERFRFSAYTIYCFFSCFTYSVGAGWIWGEHGFLKNLGVLDFAGSGPIHIIGGAGAFVSAYFIGPRIGRFDNENKSVPIGNPFNLCLGTLILMWGWYGFNVGSSYGLSNGKWNSSAKAGVSTVIASMAAGLFSMVYSMIKNKGKVSVMEVICGILCSMAAINAGCFIFSTHMSVVVGIIAAILCFIVGPIIDRLKIDDAVGATAVHLVGGIWGQISVGLFADPIDGHQGLFYGGGFYLLCIQTFSAICLALWAALTTLIILWFVNKIIPIRLSADEEILGCDIAEHVENEEHHEILMKSKISTKNMIPKYVCPCNLSTDNHLNKRKVFYINENFEP